MKKKAKYIIATVVNTVSMVIFRTSMAFAAEDAETVSEKVSEKVSSGGGDLDLSFLNGAGNGAFSKVQTTVEQTAASGKNLLIVICAAVAVLSLGVCGIKMMSTDPQKRREAKDGFFWIAFGIFICAAATGIVAAIWGIGSKI